MCVGGGGGQGLYSQIQRNMGNSHMGSPAYQPTDRTGNITFPVKINTINAMLSWLPWEGKRKNSPVPG